MLYSYNLSPSFWAAWEFKRELIEALHISFFKLQDPFNMEGEA